MENTELLSSTEITTVSDIKLFITTTNTNHQNGIELWSIENGQELSKLTLEDKLFVLMININLEERLSSSMNVMIEWTTKEIDLFNKLEEKESREKEEVTEHEHEHEFNLFKSLITL